MPIVVVSSYDLKAMGLGELQALASRVGVGYAELGEQALREKLILEGEPSE